MTGRGQARWRKGAFDGLLHTRFFRAGEIGLLDKPPDAAVDSTGLETRHASAHVCRGPPPGSPAFTPVMRQAAGNVRFTRVTADKAYDAEHNHVPCRQELGIGATVIPINQRAHPGRVPKTRYRRLTRTRFPRRVYGQRPQAENRFSRHKRLPGSVSTAKREDRQHDEIRMRVLTHNLALLAGASS